MTQVTENVAMRWDSRVLGPFWDVSNDTELSRLHHTSLIVDRFMYIFGGLTHNRNKEVPTNSLIKYNLESGEYEKIEYKNDDEESKESKPPSLYHHTLTLVESKSGVLSMYLFGGRDEFGNASNNIYQYNIKKQEWTLIKPKGNPPSPRYSHSAINVDSQYLYIFGGTNGKEYFNDLYIFCTETNTWSHLRPNGTGPSDRAGHTCVQYGTKIYVFGGGSDSNYYNDLYSLDLETLYWEKVKPSTNTVPMARIYHTASVIGNKMIIFGGVGRFYSNEVMVFDMETLTWKNVSLESNCHIPPCLFGHTACHRGTKLWIFGGKCFIEESKEEQYSSGLLYTLETGIKGVEPITIIKNTLHSDLKFLINHQKSSDITIHLLNNTFYGHRAIFKIRCPKLFSYVKEDVIRMDEILEKQLLQKCDDIVFTALLEYIYTDSIPDLDNKRLNILYQIARNLSLDRLIQMCLNVDTVAPSTLHLDLKQLYDASQRTDEDEMRNEEEEVESSSVSSNLSIEVLHYKNTFCDITFWVQEKEYIYAHKCILMARSNLFKNMLLYDPDRKEFEITGIRPEVFKLILEYLYTGHADIHFDVSLELLIASEVYELERLSLMCQAVIERKIHIHNACKILMIAENYGIKHLREACVYFIIHHFSQVKKTQGYRELDHELKFELKQQKKSISSVPSYKKQKYESGRKTKGGKLNSTPKKNKKKGKFKRR